MRRLVPLLVIFALSMLLPCGCGERNPAGALTEILETRSGEIQSLSFTCITEDGEQVYREEVDLRFPDDYLYRFYDYPGEQPRLMNVAAQSGNNVFRARAVPDQSGAVTSLEIERLSNVPPLRCSGMYLSLYHLVGDGDYFQSMISLVEEGVLEVKGLMDLEGRKAYQLRTTAGLQPDIRIWVDKETGLPLRKELAVGDSRTVVFRYQDMVENGDYPEEPFPPDVSALSSGLPPEAVKETRKDGGCTPLDPGNARAVLGFSPLVPGLEGYELAGASWRDPKSSSLSQSEQSLQYPEGFRELYLVLRSGPRQVEIRETTHHPDFAYYSTSLGFLSGAYLTQQVSWGEETGNAAYTVALDCQQLYFTAGNLDIMVTGDLSARELETLAVQMQDLACSQP
jgi:hypothetical protein